MGIIGSLDGVLQGITKNDRKQMEESARASGMVMARKITPALSPSYRWSFKQMGFGLHHEFDSLADAVKAGESQLLLERTAKLTSRCNGCHQVYRLGVEGRAGKINPLNHHPIGRSGDRSLCTDPERSEDGRSNEVMVCSKTKWWPVQAVAASPPRGKPRYMASSHILPNRRKRTLLRRSVVRPNHKPDKVFPVENVAMTFQIPRQQSAEVGLRSLTA